MRPPGPERKADRAPARRRGVSGWTLALALALKLNACAEDVPEETLQPEESPPAPLQLRPGDSLLDHLDRARVESYPATSLPADLRTDQPVVRMRSRRIAADDWIPAGIPPPPIAARLESDHPFRYFKAQPGIHPLEEDGAVDVFWQARKRAPWDWHAEEFPGEVVWWEPQQQSLFALTLEPPADVFVEYLAFATDELARHERTAVTSAPPVSRFELARVSRPGMLLPAPARLSFAIDRLDADELRLAVAILDHGFVRRDGCLEPAPGQSDGARVAVELTVGKETRRLYEHTILRDEVARGYHEARIDLTGSPRERVKLTLISEPGAAGNADFDYVVWSGLQLAGTPRRKPGRPHVILIDIDTLRADRLGCYGYARPTTPHLDAWARDQAMVYRNTVSTASWTLPSTVSILTGLSVHQHGIEQFPQVMTDATPPLALLLARAGYETFGIGEGGYVKAAFGFDLGFGEYRTGTHKQPDWRPALEWLAARRSERPFFLFLHTYLVHAPYPYDPRFEDPTAPYTGPFAGQNITYANALDPVRRGALELTDADQKYISGLYDALVVQADELVHEFLEAADRLLDGEDYVVIVTSDHGEEFLEHGKLGHGHTLHGEQLRVPLLVRFPGSAAERPRGVTHEPTSTLDIVPTVLDCAGVVPPYELPGRSLLRAAPTRATARVARLLRKIQSVQSGGYKMIVDRRADVPEEQRVQLYQLRTDPLELEDVSDRYPDKVEGLTMMLSRHLSRYAVIEPTSDRPSRVSASILQSLRDLGYLEEE